MKIKQLPENAIIINLNPVIFKAKNYDSWLISVDHKESGWLYDKQKPAHKTKLKFSNMPMLARNRIYNSTEFDLFLDYQSAKFTIQNLGDCNSDGRYFEYITNVNYQDSLLQNIKIRIPKLELARVLFFHNSYLAISSLQERVLDLDFKTKQENCKNIIIVQQHCSLAKTLFEDLSFRSKLSWLLLNAEMKKSYYSIYENLVKNKTVDENFERWLFDFIPPRFTNLNFEIKGYLKDSDILYVNEILNIKGLDSGITKEVIFESNKFVQELNTKGATKKNSSSKASLELTINDEYDASSILKPLIVETTKTGLEFLSPIVSKIKPNKTVKKSTCHAEIDETDNRIVDDNMINLATDEATTTGTAPKGEFHNTDDTTNRDIRYRQNFLGLLSALENLELDNLVIQYHQLPSLPRCRLDKKFDGNKRTLLEARFSYKNQEFIIFEIDTTDLPTKRLSTLIIKDMHNMVNINDLLKIVVKNSLTWSKLNFSEKINLIHPKDFYNGTYDLQVMAEGWSQRILQAIIKLNNYQID